MLQQGTLGYNKENENIQINWNGYLGYGNVCELYSL